MKEYGITYWFGVLAKDSLGSFVQVFPDVNDYAEAELSVMQNLQKEIFTLTAEDGRTVVVRSAAVTHVDIQSRSGYTKPSDLLPHP